MLEAWLSCIIGERSTFERTNASSRHGSWKIHREGLLLNHRAPVFVLEGVKEG